MLPGSAVRVLVALCAASMVACPRAAPFTWTLTRTTGTVVDDLSGAPIYLISLFCLDWRDGVLIKSSDTARSTRDGRFALEGFGCARIVATDVDGWENGGPYGAPPVSVERVDASAGITIRMVRVECAGDGDCAPGTRCRANQCIPGCNRESGCADGGHCAWHTFDCLGPGECVNDDGECPPATHCDGDGKCVPGCNSRTGCGDAGVCGLSGDCE